MTKARRSRVAFIQLESLDHRIVLDAAPITGPLFRPPAAYSLDHVLVRFDDAHAVSGFSLPGTEVGPALSLVPGLRQVYLESGVTVDEALATYRADRRVLYAQPDYVISTSGKPNDPSFGSQWALHNTGQSGGSNDSDLDAPGAWDDVTGSGRTVVAVIDSGVDWHHQDLAANIWRNVDEIAGNRIDDDGNGYVDDVRGWDFVNNDNNPTDDDGHGTHVAGIIGAVGNNGIGIAGINWRVQIMPLKFLDDQGYGYNSDAIRALKYAVANGAALSNHSWGGGGYDQALYDAIKAARTAGHVVVAAAGNDGGNNDRDEFYPANYELDNVVSVAATDRNDRLVSWSNFGARSVDLAAPGSGILSTTPDNTYKSYSGTSMAAPHVTGVLALVRDAHPDWTYRQVIQQVLRTVDPVEGLRNKVTTGGRLNADKAVGGVPKDTAGPFVTQAVAGSDASGSVTSVRITFSEPIDAASFTLADVAEFAGPAGALMATSITPVAGSQNQAFDVPFPAQNRAGSYQFFVGSDVRDVAGNRMDQDADGTSGEPLGDRYQVQFNVSKTQTFGSSEVVTIRDGRRNVSYLQVTSSLKIKDLNVQVSISHPYLNDLYLRLRGPGGQEIVLANRRGGSGDNFENTTFDDEATTRLTTNAAPYRGNYKPDAALSAFDGLEAKGRWELWVDDKAFGDSGTLHGWSLVLEPRATAAKKSVAQQAPRLTQIAALDYLFLAQSTKRAQQPR